MASRYLGDAPRMFQAAIDLRSAAKRPSDLFRRSKGISLVSSFCALNPNSSTYFDVRFRNSVNNTQKS